VEAVSRQWDQFFDNLKSVRLPNELREHRELREHVEK
jgi:hypothetical protein